MPESINEKAREILKNSEQIYSPEQVQKTIVELASELNRDFGSPDQTPPLVMSVMGGAAIFTGQLLPHLTFPLELISYMFHVTVTTSMAENLSGKSFRDKTSSIGLSLYWTTFWMKDKPCCTSVKNCWIWELPELFW